ncbi:MAG: hypothetical protein NDI81_02425 [Desulfobacula sp.]|nr:hypothetical protein [Desulfobacula sp.]MDA8135019.1 hypothetical protein [Desulfobacteraceae bacterium]
MKKSGFTPGGLYPGMFSESRRFGLFHMKQCKDSYPCHETAPFHTRSIKTGLQDEIIPRGHGSHHKTASHFSLGDVVRASGAGL